MLLSRNDVAWKRQGGGENSSVPNGLCCASWQFCFRGRKQTSREKLRVQYFFLSVVLILKD